MRFVISVWNEFANDADFEQTIPLEFNGKRLASLGEPNRVDVLVLEGLDRLSAGYLGRLRELGYRIHDGQPLAGEYASRIPKLVESYRGWGGIKHFSFLRFLVMPRFFSGEDIVAIGGDMVFNTGFAEMEAAVGDRLYLLGESTCFASIPANSGFFDLFDEHLSRFLDDPDSYAKDVMGLADAAALLDPYRSGGTDQAFVRHLLRKGLIRADVDRLTDHGLFAFSNWLTLDEATDFPYRYERRAGVEYLNGQKILLSHMSNDTWVYLWAPLALSRQFGRENLHGFGRIPLRRHYHQGPQNEELRQLLNQLSEAFQAGSDGGPGGMNFCSRGAVIKHYYEDSDLGEILADDRLWHTPGTFSAPPA